MNAVNAMLRDQQEAELAAAVVAANEWLNLARPIIMATFKLEDLELEITRGSSFRHHDHGYRTLSEARGYIESAREKLNEMLEGIRDDFLADNSKRWMRDLPEAEGDAIDAFNDALGEETLTIAQAVKIVESEWNAA